MTRVKPLFEFEHTYARAVPQLSLSWTVQPAPEPRLLVFNEPLAAELGADPARLREPAGVRLLTGTPPDHVPQADTFAQAYAGHQFGGYSPRLGDGRALLLGEVIDRDGERRDVHLKGSGRTPFARGGDGKAVVGPMLREYLVSEAMHALGIPTSRALAVSTTGEKVARDGTFQPGAVLARVAASHLRVGTVQYAAASGDSQIVRALLDYAIWRHHPEAAEAANPYLALYENVARAQARLVAQWMGVGFIHGVMNTDNMTLSGQTIDYGPCAFMDLYDPTTVFSSIDLEGRYAYGNQPGAAQWNLARLGEALVPVLADEVDAAVEIATEVLARFAGWFTDDYGDIMATKLGLPDRDDELVGDLTDLMRTQRVDYTSFFRALAAGQAGDLFDEPEAFAAWSARRDALLPGDREGVAERMNRVNPVHIPRNHRLEEALARATQGDLREFERLLSAVTRPFEERAGFEDLIGPAPAGCPQHVTYCGT